MNFVPNTNGIYVRKVPVEDSLWQKLKDVNKYGRTIAGYSIFQFRLNHRLPDTLEIRRGLYGNEFMDLMQFCYFERNQNGYFDKCEFFSDKICIAKDDKLHTLSASFGRDKTVLYIHKKQSTDTYFYFEFPSFEK